MTHEITTRRRCHFRHQGHDTPGTYRASVWDHEEQRWEERYAGVSRMGLRAVIRDLEEMGWSEMSYLIERE